MICYPDGTSWDCAYTEEQLVEMRTSPDTAARMARSEALAWYSLAALCAWQIGVCADVVRPCSARCSPPGTWIAAPVNTGQQGALPLRTIGRSFTPHIVGGDWVNSCGCSNRDACSCGPVDEVILPGPVGTIVEVKIDGTIIDPTWYRVDNGNRLVAQHEGLKWPLCQDMSSAPTAPPTFEPVIITPEPGTTITFTRAGDVASARLDLTSMPLNYPGGTLDAAFRPANGSANMYVDDYGFRVAETDWEVMEFGAIPGSATFQWLAGPAAPVVSTNTFEVTYYRGAAPNEMTKYAAGLLAAEFYKACGGEACKLSRKVKTVVRGGASYELDWNLFDDGWTRIEAVDAVIRIYNPHHAKTPSRIISPDGPSRVRRTTWMTR